MAKSRSRKFFSFFARLHSSLSLVVRSVGFFARLHSSLSLVVRSVGFFARLHSSLSLVVRSVGFFARLHSALSLVVRSAGGWITYQAAVNQSSILKSCIFYLRPPTPDYPATLAKSSAVKQHGSAATQWSFSISTSAISMPMVSS